MKKLSLKNAKMLSRKEMKAISGGYSWAYCMTIGTSVIIGTWEVYTGSYGTSWDACRRA